MNVTPIIYISLSVSFLMYLMFLIFTIDCIIRIYRKYRSWSQSIFETFIMSSLIFILVSLNILFTYYCYDVFRTILTN